jgi:hypothetical protein
LPGSRGAVDILGLPEIALELLALADRAAHLQPLAEDDRQVQMLVTITILTTMSACMNKAIGTSSAGYRAWFHLYPFSSAARKSLPRRAADASAAVDDESAVIIASANIRAAHDPLMNEATRPRTAFTSLSTTRLSSGRDI